MTSHSCLSSSPCTILLILLVSLSGCCPCHLHTGPQASSISAGYLLSPHNTFSFASHLQFDPSQGPTDLSPPSHISRFFPTVSCHCLFFPWMAQKGWRTEENRQAGRTASTEFSKEDVGKPLAPLSACPLPAQHRPGPSSSVQHTNNCQ